MKEFKEQVLIPGGISVLILIVCGLLVLGIAGCCGEDLKTPNTGTDPNTGVVYYKGYMGTISCPVYNSDGSVKVDKEE